MDFSESTKLVYNRIQTLEPENFSKIIGYLLLQGIGGSDMIRLAFGPETLIMSLINRAKAELGLSEPSLTQFHIDSLSPVPAGPRMFQPGPHPHWDGADSGPEMFPLKVCHYFIKGHCKHGNNCKYFHPAPESLLLSQCNGQFLLREDQQQVKAVSPRSLERLEVEITELLRSRRGVPLSIASLPMMYYEKYGRSLQAEGYLTESQRHGKTGFSLTKLLARLSNSIRLIDRPHGQHSVVLVEDVGQYLEYNGNDANGSVSGSRQIYLTFPAESTFSELDVSNYFNKFGPVQDVRIPCQQKRMFGFVTFVYSETVRLILAKGNPHFVCDARVLVKPYREKSRLFDRKLSDKTLHRICPHFVEEDLDYTSLSPRTPDKWGFRKFDKDQAFEFERRCFSEMNLTSNKLSNRPYFNHSMDELKLPNDNNNSNNNNHNSNNNNNFSIDDAEQDERINYLLDVLNNASTSDDQNITTDHNDQDSVLNLPENPFASTVGNNGISTFT